MSLKKYIICSFAFNLKIFHLTEYFYTGTFIATIIQPHMRKRTLDVLFLPPASQSPVSGFSSHIILLAYTQTTHLILYLHNQFS